MARSPSSLLGLPPSARGAARSAVVSAEVGALAARLVGEMTARWRQGEQPGAEEFLTRHPQLCEQPAAALQLIYEEICLRQELGQEVTAAEVVRRFPQWREQLEVLLDCHRLLQVGQVAPVFPKVGESLGDYYVLAELGRGAQGRVFLATQPSLADRPVVLKITPCNDREHLRLARLQHTHIVPLYAVHDDPAHDRRLLCMPYYGGITLANLLERLQHKPFAERTGQQLRETLAQAQAEAPVIWPVQGPGLQLLARLSYVQALCWIGACLAEALHYAHERGLVHLDLKPANVLLAADGQPMLLDFHLAQEPLRPDTPAPAWIGGTAAYMSPEQRAALAAVQQGRPIPVVVDGRSDLFALGALLYEALGGRLPDRGGGAVRLRHSNPQVSVGLADVLHKCLAADAHVRYADARALAIDLRRHLADLPLRGVGNRSLSERWRKWRRRRPYTLALVGMLLVLVGMVLTMTNLLLLHASWQFREARAALLDGQEQLQKHQYALAERTLTRGWSRVAGWPRSEDLGQAFATHLRRVRHAQAAQQLHLVTDQLRFLYGAESLSAAEQHHLQACCHQVWDARHQLTQGAEAELESDLEQRLRTDLLDLGIIWTDLQVRLAPAHEADAARREALRVLAEVETQFGPSPVLYRQRQLYAAALGQTELARAAGVRAAELVPQTAWEHYGLGRFLLRSGSLERAVAELDRAVELQPQGFWFRFYQGICAHRLHQYEKAVQAFEVCLALEPTTAACYYNRALARAARGQTDQALQDYSRALQLDAGLAAAALNRGLLHHQKKRYAAARADLELALSIGAEPANVHYRLALVHWAQKDRAAALASLRQALKHQAGHREALALQARIQGAR
ncbi:MAG: protein kinase [Gemmataceae bacterium]|nr:protein kinase [Gemmataceae bacterium]